MINQNTWITITAIAVLSWACAAGGQAMNSSGRVYVGTYTGGTSEGIYVFDFDAATGAMSDPILAAATENPSFLALHPSLPVLYAVGEQSDGGTVSAFHVDTDTGMLTLINEQSSVGGGPCHVAVAPNGRHVAVANYGGGSTALLPVDAEGRLSEASDFVQHEGSGPDPKRQEGPHAHAVYFDPGSRYLYVADLGLDKVFIYDYDANAGTLRPHDTPYVDVEPGAGPRHVAFDFDAGYAFIVNEMGNTVTACAYDGDTGTLQKLESVPTLPEGFSEPSTTAEIEVGHDGRFVYASNRGHDSIAVFEIDPASGSLTAVGHTPTGGKTPRNFTIDPTGKYLLAANQDTGNIVAFAIDQDTGGLTATGEEIAVGKPVCLVFAP